MYHEPKKHRKESLGLWPAGVLFCYLPWAMSPSQATCVFISYASSDVGLALFVQRLLEARVPPGVSVFVAKRDITPGANPLKVMLEEQLPRAEALIAICSRQSKASPWLWWEAAAVWARQGLVVPLFADLSASEFDGPLTLVCQGGRFGDTSELANALHTVLARVSPGCKCPDLSAVEIEELGALQSTSDSSDLEIEVTPGQTKYGLAGNDLLLLLTLCLRNPSDKAAFLQSLRVEHNGTWYAPIREQPERLQLDATTVSYRLALSPDENAATRPRIPAMDQTSRFGLFRLPKPSGPLPTELPITWETVFAGRGKQTRTYVVKERE